MIKPTALIILDGWGQSNDCTGNAILKANTPQFDALLEKYPHTLLGASGMDVGLPEGQMGNSEVGHLNIGAGRIIYQELTRITKAIKDGDFFENEAFVDAMQHAKKAGTKLHLWGLLSDGGVHSHIDHLKALIKMAQAEGLDNVYVHGFMDGRDTSPNGGAGYVKELEDYMAEIGFGCIASLSGRYYAMDRDNRWERIERAYDALVRGKGHFETNAVRALEKSYAEGITDEFIEPTVIIESGEPVATVEENDAIIFFNFRPDRAREMTRAITDSHFSGFKRKFFKTHYVCLTQYDITFKNVEVAFKPQQINQTLGSYFSSLGKKQLRIAETEKYAHVTFFFNGGVEAPNEGEERVLVDSPKVATYDLMPEMSAYEVTNKLLKAIDEDQYELIVLNFANPDMVGHTGIMDAAIKAVEVVDECLGKVVAKLESKEGQFIITADHGNAEEMMTEDGKPMTAHSVNKVPCIVGGTRANDLTMDGRLCDLAPTLLTMMGIEIPKEMTGKSILK